MAWTRVDDDFLGHGKVARAAEILGRFGLGRVLVIWHQGQSHANRYLTDGFLSLDTVKRFHDDPQPLKVAEALVGAGLWETARGGYRIHDYLDYNPSRETVLAKRARDLERKLGPSRSKEIPRGIHAESNAEESVIPPRKNDGITDDEPPIPEEFRVDSNATRAGGSARPVPRSQTRHGNGTKTGTSPGVSHTAPGVPGRKGVAWSGRPPVPGQLHADFVEKLGGDQEEASRRLVAWYPVAAASWADTAIGDDDFTFWRARFREWQGTTVTPPNGSRRSAEQLPTEPDQDDWFDECKRLHDHQCNGKLGHRTRMAVDAARAQR